jgi:large subunit ribosomal protein L10
MAITKAKKVEIIERLSEIKTNADAIVFVHYTGLSLADTTAMRKELREQGVGYFVAKKTLMARVFGDSFTGTMPTLDNEIAIAYSTDPMAPAQSVKSFSEKYKDKFVIVGGVFQGVFKDKAEMTEIASIPSLQVLRGMFVNIINSPIQGLAVALQAVADKKSV